MSSQKELTPKNSQLSNNQDPASLLGALFAISSKEGPESIAEELARQMVAFSEADYCCVLYGAPGEHQLTQLGLFPPDADFPHKDVDFLDLPLIAEAHQEAAQRYLTADSSGLSPQGAEFFAQNAIRSLYCLPLCSHDRSIGMVLLFCRTELSQFSQDLLDTLSSFSNHAGIIIDQAILIKKANQRAHQLEGLRRASLTVTSSLELNDVFKAVLENAMNLSPDAMDAHMFLYEDDRLVFAKALWADGTTETEYIEPRQDGLTYRIARGGEMVVVENVLDHELFPNPAQWGDEDWSGAIIGIPLKIGAQVVGVMNIAYQIPRIFESDELSTLGLLADQAAIAIDNARLHRLVRQQSLTDPLTGAYNRRAFNKHLNDLLEYAAEHNGTFTMMMVDLNHFKQVNDTYGHSAGDDALIKVTESLESVIRGRDFLARYGGDEFAILLPETDLKTAQKIGERLEIALYEKVVTVEGNTPLNLSLTVGIAEYPTHGLTFDEIVSYADNAMYTNKGRKALSNSTER
jgi:diguanylate cyclase (GGDEF)-like protein